MRWLFIAIASLGGCARERTVEAPVVDVMVGSADGGIMPMALGPPPVPSSEPNDDGGLIGRWEGVGTQDDGLSWPFIVDIRTTARGVCATADYPSIPCKAEWSCTRFARGVLSADEKLSDDSVTRCVDNGKLTVHLNPDGTLEFAWRGQGQTAQATLRRMR